MRHSFLRNNVVKLLQVAGVLVETKFWSRLDRILDLDAPLAVTFWRRLHGQYLLTCLLFKNPISSRAMAVRHRARHTMAQSCVGASRRASVSAVWHSALATVSVNCMSPTAVSVTGQFRAHQQHLHSNRSTHRPRHRCLLLLLLLLSITRVKSSSPSLLQVLQDTDAWPACLIGSDYTRATQVPPIRLEVPGGYASTSVLFFAIFAAV